MAQVSIRIETAASAAFDDGVEDGAAFSGLGFADEQPISFSEGSRPDRIFHIIVIDLDASVIEVNTQQRPQVEDVIESQAHAAAGQVAPLYFKTGQGAMEPLINRPGLMSADGGPKLWATAAVPKLSFDLIKVNDLAEQPCRSAWVLCPRFVNLPARVSPAGGKLDVLLAAGEAGVGRVPIALHRALKIDRQHVVQARCRPAGFPPVNDISTGTRGGPKVAGLGFAISRCEEVAPAFRQPGRSPRP